MTARQQQEAVTTDDSPLMAKDPSPADLIALTCTDQAALSPQASSEPDASIQSTSEEGCTDHATNPAKLALGDSHQQTQNASKSTAIELRFLVRRREAGALIGKRGSNIKRLRDTFRSSVLSIPDTGNGPERVVCIATDETSLDDILGDLTQLLLEKSPEHDNQIELKLLIHSSHAGSIIGIGGQSIKKLRNDSKAAIKIYEMCCPLSNERVCAIKAKPPVVVTTIKLVQEILSANPIKGTMKPYDALNFDLQLVDKYGGYLPDEHLDMIACTGSYDPFSFATKTHFPLWRESNHHHHELLYDVPVNPTTVHASSFGRQRQSSQSEHPDGRSAKHSNNGGQRFEDGASSLESSGETKSNVRPVSYQSRVPRFHPYTRQQLVYAPLTQRSTIRPPSLRCQPMAADIDSRLGQQSAYHLQYRNSPAQPRMQGMISTNQHSRCQHSRPCLCMYLPIMPGEPTISAAPFVQLMDTFEASRGSTQMYKKK